jgi:hypothetical protein
MPPQQPDPGTPAAPAPPPGQPRRLLSPEEFAGIWRHAYPELSKETDDDRLLTHAIVGLYPEFGRDVVDVLGGAEMAQAPPTAAPLPGLRPPPSPISLEPYGPDVGPLETIARQTVAAQAQVPVQETYTRQREAAVNAAYQAQKQQRERRHAAGLPPKPTGITLPPAEAPPPEALSQFVTHQLGSFPTGLAGAIEGTPDFLRAIGQGPAMTEWRLPHPPTMSEPEVAHAVAKFANNSMEAGTFLIPEGLAKHPIQTVVGLFFGIGTSHILNEVGQSQGWDPRNTELVSTLGGLITGITAAWSTRVPGAVYRHFDARATEAELAKQYIAAAEGEAIAQPIRAAAAAEQASQQAIFQRASDAIREMQEERRAKTRELYTRAWLNRVRETAALQGTQPSPFTAIDAANTNLLLQHLDQFTQLSDGALTRMANYPTPYSPPPPPLELSPRGGTGRDYGPGPGGPILGAPPDYVPPQIESTTATPYRGPRVAASTEEPPAPLTPLTELLEGQLRAQPQPAPGTTGPPRPAPATAERMRGRLREQQSYLDAFEQEMLDATSQMEDMPHERGRLVWNRGTQTLDEANEVFLPPVPGAPIYHDIVGHDTANPPTRAYITAIMQAWRETRAKTGNELLTAGEIDANGDTAITRLQARLGLKTTGGARRAYDTWIPEVRRAVDKNVRRRLSDVAWLREKGGVEQPTPPPEPIPDFMREDYQFEPEKTRGEPLEPGSQGELPGTGPQPGISTPTGPPPEVPFSLRGPAVRGTPPVEEPLPLPEPPEPGQEGMIRLDLLVPFADKLDRWAEAWHAGKERRAAARQQVLDEIDRAIDQMIAAGRIREDDAPKVQETLQEVLERRAVPSVRQLEQSGRPPAAPTRQAPAPPPDYTERTLVDYQLPDGTVVKVDDSAAKGAATIDFTLQGGKIVQATRVSPVTPGIGARIRPFVKPEQQRTVTLYRWEPESGTGTGVPDWVRQSPDYQASQQAAGSWYTDTPEHLEFYKRESEGRGRVVQIQVTPEEAERLKVANNPQAPHARFSADPEHEYFVPADVRARARTATPKPTGEDLAALHERVIALDDELGHPFGDRDDFSAMLNTATEDLDAGTLQAALQDLEAVQAQRWGRGSEQQPALPGAESVRETETPTPEFEAPFSLTPPEHGTPPPSPIGQPSLFGAEPPGPVGTLPFTPKPATVPPGWQNVGGVDLPPLPESLTAAPKGPAQIRPFEKPGGEPSEAPPEPPPEPGAPPAPLKPGQPSLFDRLKGEEGRIGKDRISLIGLRDGTSVEQMTRWLKRNRAAYGDTDWFKEVEAAVDRGDGRTAFRTVLVVETLMNKEVVQTPKIIPGEQVRQPGGQYGPSQPKQILEPTTPGYKVAKKDIESILGVPLPPDFGVDTVGGTYLGDLHGRLRMPATDMLLAGSIVRPLIDATDPTKVILIPGNTDTRLRLFRQIADQIAREMPDEIVQPLMELTGIKDPIELAKHFTRRASDAGRLLQSLSAWRDANWDQVVKLTREGFGDTLDDDDVAGLSSRTPNGFLKWLYTEATPEDLKNIGFRPPPTIKFKTKEGDAWAKRWFRSNLDRQARTKGLQETIDNLTKEMSWLNIDRLMLQGSLDASRGGRKRDAIDITEDTSRAFAISQLSTANRNFDTQGIAYNVAGLDDLLGAAASGLFGVMKKAVGMESAAPNLADAKRLITHARELAKAAWPGFAGGSSGRVGVRSMLRHPLTDTMQVVYDLHREQLKGMSSSDVRKVLAVVDEFPRHAAALLGATSFEEAGGAGGEAGGAIGVPQTKLERYAALAHKARNFVTTPTRIQEAMYRGMAASASFRSQLREKGLDPAAVLAGDDTGDPFPGLVERFGQQEVERMAGIAVSSALNATFAAKPYPGTIPDALMRIFSAEGIGPVLRTGYPFPRFNLVNAPRWFYDHSLAGLFDAPLYALNVAGRAIGVPGSAPFKGRLYRGIEAGLIHDQIPKITQQINGAQYDLAVTTQEYTAATLAAKQAGIEYRRLERRAEQTDTLPDDIKDAMVRVGEEMHAQINAADDALADHRDAGRRLKEFKRQQQLYEEKEMAATEAGMPKSFGEYWGRQASGLALLGAALVIRSSRNADDTKWYEYRIKGHTYDFRAYSPVPVPFLLPADVLIDAWRHTDWDQFHQIRNDYFANHPDADRWNPYTQSVATEQAMEQAYHGKYTGESLRNEAAAAFFSMSRAMGITSAVIDYLTGQTGSSGSVGHEGIQQRIAAAVFTTIGQFLGRFTTPGQIPKDIIGQFSPEEAKARIPEESTPEHPNLTKLLYQPALAHLPGASRYIPEKISPFTGQPITGVNTGLRQLVGLTERDRNRFEDELNRTGTSYGTLAPRAIGERDFDNSVAEHYAEILRTTIGPKLLDNARYANPKTEPDVKRELISKYIGGAKLKAYVEAGKDWNLDARETRGLTSPAQAERRRLLKRWIGLLQQQTLEDHPELKNTPTEPEPEPRPEPPPQPFGVPPPQAFNQYGPPPSATL